MFNSCKKLISINISNFNTSLVKNMNYMFAECHSLKFVEINNINTSSLITMSHMFENCYSLRSINLSSFNLELTQNMEYMFANDNQLVYVNFLNANDSGIKRMNNIFLGTLENMVFCINESLSRNIYGIISRKRCTAIDCSKNWTLSRKLILASNGQCVDECPKKAIFFHDYKCYYRCPNETLPEDFECKESFDTYIDPDSCTINNYFLGACKKRLYTPLDKKHFIESTVNDFLKGKLYGLALMSLENQKKFIIREETETYAIYALSNKNRENDLVYINMDECIEALKETYKLSNDFIIFQIQYKSPDLKIPIVEYNICIIWYQKIRN